MCSTHTKDEYLTPDRSVVFSISNNIVTGANLADVFNATFIRTKKCNGSPKNALYQNQWWWKLHTRRSVKSLYCFQPSAVQFILPTHSPRAGHTQVPLKSLIVHISPPAANDLLLHTKYRILDIKIFIDFSTLPHPSQIRFYIPSGYDWY